LVPYAECIGACPYTQICSIVNTYMYRECTYRDTQIHEHTYSYLGCYTQMMHLLTDMDMNTHIDRYPASDYKTNQLV